MTKKNIMPVAVLTAICVVVAALLGVVNMLTAPIIEAAEAQKVYDSFRNVLDGVYEDADVPENAPNSVTAMYKVTDNDGKLLGHVATVTVKGYADNISVTVGVDADGKVTKAEVTASAETHGKAGMKNYTDNFAGLDAAGVAEVDTFSGATISSTAIRGAILDAVNAITGVESDDSGNEETLPKTDDEIISLAKELIGKDVELANVTPEGTTLVKRMYKASENSGYVAYIVAISPNYGTVETETLIHISNTGKIVNINKLLWKTSDAIYGYVPPTEDVVNEFYGRLPGNNSGSIGEVELVTNATSTSTRLVDGIKEALSVADTLIKKDMPTEETRVKELAKELVGKDVELVDVTPDNSTLVKKMYKAGGDGYVAYVVVISSNYGTVETETLIHIGNDGKIVKINKMVWKTSDAIYGYVPPTEDVVNEFYGRLPGNNSGSIGEVDLVTNATNTSTNLMNGIKEALTAADTLIKNDMPTEETRVKELAKELVGKDVELTDVTPNGTKFVRRIYKAGSEGYVAYVVAISPNYGTVETETLIHIGNDGKIVKINKLLWKTSDAINGYVPPTEDVVNEFYGRLPGNNSGTIGEVELVTHATNTATRLVDGIKEALAAADTLIEGEAANKVDNTARIVGVTVIVLALGAAIAFTVIKRKRRVVK